MYATQSVKVLLLFVEEFEGNRFSVADIHVSDGEPGLDAGSSWRQEALLQINGSASGLAGHGDQRFGFSRLRG